MGIVRRIAFRLPDFGKVRTRSMVCLVAVVSCACSDPSLFGAAAGNDVDGVRQMLADSATVSDRDARGWTALHFAAAGGAIDAIAVLAEAGADPGAVAEQGFTPLHVAVVEANLETVRALVEAGAPLDATALDGVTAEQLAARRGDSAVADYLRSVSAR